MLLRNTKQQPIKKPLITCNECKHQFKLKNRMVKKDKVTEEIERSYFKCPKCKHRYIIFYEDQEFKNNIEKMDKLKKEMSELEVSSDQAKQTLEEYNNLLKKNVEISKGYKSVYGS